MAEETRWFTPMMAAELLGVSRSTIYRLLPRLSAAGVEVRREGEGGRISIDRASLQSWYARQQLPGTNPAKEVEDDVAGHDRMARGRQTGAVRKRGRPT